MQVETWKDSKRGDADTGCKCKGLKQRCREVGTLEITQRQVIDVVVTAWVDVDDVAVRPWGNVDSGEIKDVC